MGAWGIKALERDEGLDVLDILKNEYVPEHPVMDLGEMIELMKEEVMLGSDFSFFQKSSPFTNFNKRNIKCFLKDDRSIDGFYLQYYLNNVKNDLKPQIHSVDTV